MIMPLSNQTRCRFPSKAPATSPIPAPAPAPAPKLAPLWLSLLLLCGCSLAACSTLKTVPVYPTLPSTSCPVPTQIPAADLASDDAFASWLGSAVGRQYLADEREHSWECYRKLKAVHDFALTWPKTTK